MPTRAAPAAIARSVKPSRSRHRASDRRPRPGGRAGRARHAKKHRAGYPENAIACCLSPAIIWLADVEYVAVCDKPLLKSERLLGTYLAFAPRGVISFTAATGNEVDSGEHKVMELAPYRESRFAQLIFEKVLDLKDDGTFGAHGALGTASCVH